MDCKDSIVYELVDNPLFNREYLIKKIQKSLKENYCGYQSIRTINSKLFYKLFTYKELIVIKEYFKYEIKNILTDVEEYD